MKGCLSFIFKVIIAILVFYGLVHIGAIDFIKEKINEYNNPSQEKIIEQSKDVVDLSEISDEYNVEKNFEILNNKMIIAEHEATGQKMLIVEPSKANILTAEDITSPNLQEKLNNIATKKQYKFIKLEKLEVTQQSTMQGINQKIPYAKVTAEISNLPIDALEGIIGTAKTKDGKDIIVVSISEKGKYSQIITEAFYNKVK